MIQELQQMIISRVSTAAPSTAAHESLVTLQNMLQCSVTCRALGNQCSGSPIHRDQNIVSAHQLSSRISRLRSVPHALLRVTQFIEHPGSPISPGFYCLHSAEDTCESQVERKQLSLRHAPSQLRVFTGCRVSAYPVMRGQWHQAS